MQKYQPGSWQTQRATSNENCRFRAPRKHGQIEHKSGIRTNPKTAHECNEGPTLMRSSSTRKRCVDAALIAVKKVEHYEIASYGHQRRWLNN